MIWPVIVSLWDQQEEMPPQKNILLTLGCESEDESCWYSLQRGENAALHLLIISSSVGV